MWGSSLWVGGACWSELEDLGKLQLTSPSPERMLELSMTSPKFRVWHECTLTVPQWLGIPGTRLPGAYLEHTFQASSHWSILVLLHQHQRNIRYLGEMIFLMKTRTGGG